MFYFFKNQLKKVIKENHAQDFSNIQISEVMLPLNSVEYTSLKIVAQETKSKKKKN